MEYKNQGIFAEVFGMTSKKAKHPLLLYVVKTEESTNEGNEKHPYHKPNNIPYILLGKIKADSYQPQPFINPTKLIKNLTTQKKNLPATNCTSFPSVEKQTTAYQLFLFSKRH